ncbi:NTR domain-containing protein [Meloidogyne graminicola]|uniref:NTR domain-containing protein n=1 Tax=Meloidogyne graminicola TaxID=189291 RepID=A0A8S9ZY36_9BILA|nr:NTR domain-containing protein [Meloidogyne graminicola]
MKIFIFNFFTIFIILNQINKINLCKCIQLPIQTKYCNSNWVAHIKVINKEEVNNESLFRDIRYSVKYIKIYKDKKENKTCKYNYYIYTASSSAACGVLLNKGNEYLLGGIYFDNNLKKISSCGLVEDWNNLTNEDKKEKTKKTIK